MVFLLAVSVIWAFSFPLIKVHLTSLDPNVVALVRMVLATFVLLPFLRFRSITARLGLELAAIGAVQMGVMYVAYIRSFQYLQSYEVALLTILTPLWITVFSSALSKHLNPRFHLAALLAIAGAAVIVWRRDALGPALTGVLLVQVSNVAFGIGQLLFKRTLARHPGIRIREVFALLYAGAVAVTLAATAVTFQPDTFTLTSTQALVLVYLGIVAAGIGFFLWNYGATKVSDGTLAVMNNGYMPIAVLAGVIWLHEPVDVVRLLLGSILLVTALVVAGPGYAPIRARGESPDPRRQIDP